MEEFVFVLRYSTDNEKRTEFMARLKQLQEEHPQNFLISAWEFMSSPVKSDEDRFIVATLVLSFVRDSWRSWEADKRTKEEILQKYTELALSELYQKELLCRKIGSIVAVMAKYGPKSSELGMLPPFIQAVVDTYFISIQPVPCSNPTYSLLPLSPAQLEKRSYALLLFHVFLKELQTKRVGKVFEKVCEYVTPRLSEVLTRFPFSAFSSSIEYIIALRGIKCAYRVFGCGVFDPSMSCFLLTEAMKLLYRLCGNGSTRPDMLSCSSSEAGQITRLLEYVLKAIHKLLTYFPSQLHQLPRDFFCCLSDFSLTATPFDNSLFYLLYSIILCSRTRTSGEERISEKLLCRSMSIFTLCYAVEDSDSFVKESLTRFAASQLLPGLMQVIILHCLADDCTSDALARWDQNPEKGVEELDVECDDEFSPVCCAEQLFLALTGSEGSSPMSLQAAWTIVKEPLDKDLKGELNEDLMGNVSAALHAVGIGYYTMCTNSDYLSFLEMTLLPILRNTTTAFTHQMPERSLSWSVAILRRVIWMIGMWCESVPEVYQRREVHKALASVLFLCAPGSPGRGVMLALIALRSVENFVSDDHFTVEELQPPSVLESILHAVAHVLPRLQSPSVVKQQIGLLYVLMEKGAIPSPGGDTVIRLLLPVVNDLVTITSQESSPSLSREGAGEEDDDETEEERNKLKIAVLGTVLECLGGALKICSGSELLWDLLPIVVACTQPGGALAAYVEEEAWELLCTMAQYSQAYGIKVNEAIHWCLQSVSRDFSSLPTVWSCVTACILCSNLPSEQFFSEEQVLGWFHAYAVALSEELCSAYLGFFLTLMTQSQGPLRSLVAEQSLCLLTSCPYDIQDRYQPLQCALLLSVGLKDTVNTALLAHVVQAAESNLSSAERFPFPSDLDFLPPAVSQEQSDSSGVAEQKSYASLVEKILFLVDVASNLAYERALHFLLRTFLVHCSALNHKLVDAVRFCLQQQEISSRTGVDNAGTDKSAEESAEYADLYHETEMEKKERALLEVTGNSCMSSNVVYYQRLSNRFSNILFCD